MKKQRTTASMCDSISGRSNKSKPDALVAYSDAKFASKGMKTTPTSSLRQASGALCHVCDGDMISTPAKLAVNRPAIKS